MDATSQSNPSSIIDCIDIPENVRIRTQVRPASENLCVTQCARLEILFETSREANKIRFVMYESPKVSKNLNVDISEMFINILPYKLYKHNFFRYYNIQIIRNVCRSKICKQNLVCLSLSFIRIYFKYFYL